MKYSCAEESLCDTIPAPPVELIAFRGLPGSGKTTAIANLKACRPNVRVVSMDDECRSELGRLPKCEADEEVGRVRLRKLAGHLLKKGVDVIVDDMNLKEESLDLLVVSAKSLDAEFIVIDMWQEYLRQFTATTINSGTGLYDSWIELCIARDAERVKEDDARVEIGRGLISGWGATYESLLTDGTRHSSTPLESVTRKPPSVPSDAHTRLRRLYPER